MGEHFFRYLIHHGQITRGECLEKDKMIIRVWAGRLSYRAATQTPRKTVTTAEILPVYHLRRSGVVRG